MLMKGCDVMGVIMGIYMGFMSQLSQKKRIYISIIPTFLLLLLSLFYMIYSFLDVNVKKMFADVYKSLFDVREYLFILGGMSLGMLGRWKKIELCPYQLLRTVILFTFPILTVLIFYLRMYIPSYLYPLAYVLWGLQATIFIWMSLRLTKKNQNILLLAHGILFAFGFSLLKMLGIYFTEYSPILTTWGWMSIIYYFFKKFIINSQTVDNI